MDPYVRAAILSIGLMFCLFFGGAGLAEVFGAQTAGGAVLGVVSLAIVGMILIAIIGAIRNPPDE